MLTPEETGATRAQLIADRILDEMDRSQVPQDVGITAITLLFLGVTADMPEENYRDILHYFDLIRKRRRSKIDSTTLD